MTEESNVMHGYMGNIFSVSDDPLSVMADKMGILLFLRSEVRPAKNVYGLAVSGKSYEMKEEMGPYPDSFQKLGLISGIGSVVTESGKKVPSSCKAILVNENLCDPLMVDVKNQVMHGEDPIQSLASAGYLSSEIAKDAAQNVYRSDQGQIVLDAKKGLFEVKTELSEGCSGQAGFEWNGHVSKVSNGNGYASIMTTSMDGKPLEVSTHLLIFYLTDVLADGATFKNMERTIYLSHGKLPHLVRTDQAEITLQNGSMKEIQVWAVDLSGKKVASVELKKEGSRCRFLMESDRACVYEVVRQP